MHRTLEPDALAPAAARRAMESFLDTSLDATVGSRDRRNLLLLVSELVTNAVQHGGPPIELLLTVRPTVSGHSVAVEVRDCGPIPDLSSPETGSDDQVAFRGRGLMIVDQLADHWGARPNKTGTAIWCDVGISDETASLR